MMRTWVVSVGFVAAALLVAGCDSGAGKKTEQGVKKVAGEVKDVGTKVAGEVKDVAKKAAGEAEELAKEAKEGAEKMADAAKLAVLKPVEDALPKIEEKIKGLKGESATKAKENLEEFKKHLEQFKSAAPEKWQSLKDGLMKSFSDLKKHTGTEN